MDKIVDPVGSFDLMERSSSDDKNFVFLPYAGFFFFFSNYKNLLSYLFILNFSYIKLILIAMLYNKKKSILNICL